MNFPFQNFKILIHKATLIYTLWSKTVEKNLYMHTSTQTIKKIYSEMFNPKAKSQNLTILNHNIIMQTDSETPERHNDPALLIHVSEAINC